MQAKSQRETTTGEFRDTAQKIKSDSLKALSDIQDDVYQIANTTGRRVRIALDSAGEGIRDASEAVTEQIQKHPVRSSLIALGTGLVLGMLLRR